MISELSPAPLSKVCTVLSKYEVEYIIVGGTAVQYYGYHRPSRITIPMKGLAPFRECKKNARELELDGVIVHILSLEDLILNKKAVNRAVDLSDAEELEKIRNNKRKKDGRL